MYVAGCKNYLHFTISQTFFACYGTLLLQQQANYAKGWENYSLSRQMAEIEKCMKPLQAISELSKLYKAANEERLHALCLYHAQNCGYIQPQNAPQS